ncbi:coiled-coil domain-containing protein 86-like [Ornithodoros turicata]|uniref:coiled-coil domain-containing protein 86-like n=1 Tax=Ornithodoros turicata TaxID=34597 RepID=UPI003138A6D8
MSKKNIDDEFNVPRGLPKSGRPWKTPKTRFSSMQKVKPLRTSWKVKMQQRAERKALLEFSHEVEAARKKELEEKRKKSEEKRRRREENSRKAEIVQVLRNTSKIKKLSKKQLRNIKKADTTVVSRGNKKK